jgi:hypothetical protein
MDKGIEIGQVDPGEGAADREPLPFEAARGDCHAPNGALARNRRIRLRDTRQDGDVIDDDGGHVVSLSVVTIPRC